MSKYKVSCGAKTADGAFQGTLLGLSYTLAFDVPHALKVHSTPFSLPQASLKNSTSFALVFASFQGSQCLCEEIRGKNDMINSFIGGVTSGAMISYQEPLLRTIFRNAIVFGCIASIMNGFQNTHE